MKNISTIVPPPPEKSQFNIIHSAKELYKIFYITGNKLNKRDKLGIHQHTEKICLDILNYLLRASFSIKNSKPSILNLVRINLEVLKNIVRVEYELKIIDEKTYIRIETKLIELSKMTNGWIKYSENKNPPK